MGPSGPGGSACGSRSRSRSGSTSSMGEAAAKAREVVDGVVQVYLPLPMRPSIVNVYLVRAGATWTLVDTGMNTDDSVAAFRGALTEVGIAPESIVRLVGTHHHVDHFGTSGPYQELTRADVYLHPLEADRVTMMAHIEGENTEYMRRHAVPDVPADLRLPSPPNHLRRLFPPPQPHHLLRHQDATPLRAARTLA